jgi:hypothetical protein
VEPGFPSENATTQKMPERFLFPANVKPLSRGTVNGMLADFRFVLGAILAIAVLAVAGLGLVTSVRLLHEARLGPLEDGRSLAYAGHAEWNQFYDPDGARRFEGLAGRTEAPVAEARPEPAPEALPTMAPPAVVPVVGSEERTDSIPGRPEAEIVPVIAPVTVDDRSPEADPPHADPPPLPQVPAAVTLAAPPADSAGAPTVSGTAVRDAAPLERVASAPATSPAADPVPEKQAPAQEPARPHAAGNPPPDRTPSAPRARPKTQFRKKIARAHIRRIVPASRQTVQNSGFQTPNAAWPGYDGQSTGTTTKKNAGNFSGAYSYHPQ